MSRRVQRSSPDDTPDRGMPALRRVTRASSHSEEWDTITLLDTRDGHPYLDVDNHRGYSCWGLMVKIPESRTYAA